MWIIYQVSIFVFYFTVCSGLVKRDEEEHFTVVTIEEAPYLEVKNPSGKGNDNFYGFIPDLMEKISDIIKRDYKLQLVQDGQYGTKDNQGHWSGMIKEVENGDADIAAAPMTMSKERETAVDFTVPFMNIGLAILYKKPANGAAPSFTTLEELADKTDIKYGIVKSGMTENIFKTSQDPSMAKMWQNMNRNQNDLMDNNEDGVKKVKESNGKYAFILENTTAEYYVNEDCDLADIQIDTNKTYGFAVRKGFKHLTGLNEAINELKDNGVIDELKKKHWKGKCHGYGDGNSAHKSVTSSICVLLGFLLWCCMCQSH